jgi:hypothetical protein
MVPLANWTENGARPLLMDQQNADEMITRDLAFRSARLSSNKLTASTVYNGHSDWFSILIWIFGSSAFSNFLSSLSAKFVNFISRLTAIRETFEESGVLLTKAKTNETGCFSRAHTFPSTQQLTIWRKKVGWLIFFVGFSLLIEITLTVKVKHGCFIDKMYKLLQTSSYF